LIRNFKWDLFVVGFNGKRPLIQIMIALNGMGLGFIDYLILKPEALNSNLTFQMTILPALILLLSTGFVEELAFRGVMQRTASVFGSWGWVYIAAVYAILQLGRDSILHCMFVFLVALFFGWVVKKTKSLMGVSFAHGFLNIGLFLVFPHIFIIPH
jgi:uncharacterized protein